MLSIAISCHKIELYYFDSEMELNIHPLNPLTKACFLLTETPLNSKQHKGDDVWL